MLRADAIADSLGDLPLRVDGRSRLLVQADDNIGERRVHRSGRPIAVGIDPVAECVGHDGLHLSRGDERWFPSQYVQGDNVSEFACERSITEFLGEMGFQPLKVGRW